MNTASRPGLAGMFGPRQIHAIHFVEGSRFIRITGTDLSRISTRKFDMAEGTVTEVPHLREPWEQVLTRLNGRSALRNRTKSFFYKHKI